MRGQYHLAPRRANAPATPAIHQPDDDREPFVNRPCYVFNGRLRRDWNDRHCEHCRDYLTSRCHHLEDFLDDVDDLSPE